jgi:hypothetical protein
MPGYSGTSIGLLKRQKMGYKIARRCAAGAKGKSDKPQTVTRPDAIALLRGCESNATFRMFGCEPSRGSLDGSMSSEIAS